METFAASSFAAQQDLWLKQAGDPNSALYKGAMEILRECEASERRAKALKKNITIPFSLSEHEVSRLESQFGVGIRLRGINNRARLTPLVSAMVHCLDSMMLEMAGGGGRKVLIVDGDLASVSAIGIENRLVERTYATPRLSGGYFFEDSAVSEMSAKKDGNASVGASVMYAELQNGGGEHYWPSVRDDGPAVDSIVVNHFKTPVGPNQVAWLARCRRATAYGCFPFQLEMLTEDSGSLACFPGRYYIDREADVITLVPESDATMSVSHPFSSLLGFVHNNSVTVAGSEYLCEKFLTIKGVLFYTMRHVEVEFERPEILVSSFYDAKKAGLTMIKYPYVKLSAGGTPIGWEVRQKTMLTTRFERVMNRCRTLNSVVVTPGDVFKALMDYNNVVVNTLDTAVLAERMAVGDEEELALAIALLINYRRHQMKGTFNVLLDAVKTRYKIAESGLLGFSLIALSAWWAKPNVKGLPVLNDLPVDKIVDWCGNDFGVVASSVDCWFDVEEVVGEMKEKKGRSFPYFPAPRLEKSRWSRERVFSAAERLHKALTSKVHSSRFPRTAAIRAKLDPLVPTVSKVMATVTGDYVKEVIDEDKELSVIKQKLVSKLSAEQGAVRENRIMREILVKDSPEVPRLAACPVIVVDPVCAVGSDLEEMLGGSPSRDAVTTGYRLAEVDVIANVEGCITVNDAHRAIPTERWVRRPKVDAGVEGKRVGSQAALFGALKKRNVGIPPNRGAVDLDAFPDVVIDRFISVCFRDDWADVLAKHLNSGMWEFNETDIESYMDSIDERKAKSLLDEFFLEGEVDLSRWMLMAKGKIKPSREEGAEFKVDHSQTIMYLEDGTINAAYSAMTKRFKKCFDEMLLPHIQINSQMNQQEHEDWYNTMNADRASRASTCSYSVDARCYDRSQDHVGLKTEARFYARMGLNEDRLRIWSETHGAKRAVSMMFKIVMVMTQGGVSGLWKTLLRNGLIMAFSVVYSTNVERQKLVCLDVKGDDVDMEVEGSLDVDHTVDLMCVAFNLSAKFFTNNVRYFCKQFWIFRHGRWYSVADPWARIQSICTPVWVGNNEDTLAERWESIRPDLINYDNGILVDDVAEAAQQYYGLRVAPYGIARSLARFAVDRASYYNFFLAPERVN